MDTEHKEKEKNGFFEKVAFNLRRRKSVYTEEPIQKTMTASKDESDELIATSFDKKKKEQEKERLVHQAENLYNDQNLVVEGEMDRVNYESPLFVVQLFQKFTNRIGKWFTTSGEKFSNFLYGYNKKVKNEPRLSTEIANEKLKKEKELIQMAQKVNHEREIKINEYNEKINRLDENQDKKTIKQLESDKNNIEAKYNKELDRIQNTRQKNLGDFGTELARSTDYKTLIAERKKKFELSDAKVYYKDPERLQTDLVDEKYIERLDKYIEANDKITQKYNDFQQHKLDYTNAERRKTEDTIVHEYQENNNKFVYEEIRIPPQKELSEQYAKQDDASHIVEDVFGEEIEGDPSVLEDIEEIDL